MSRLLVSTSVQARAAAYLVTIAHEGASSVLGPKEAVDQHGPPQGEVEANVLLEVAAELVAGQVVAEVEALAGHQLVYLLPDRGGQQGLHTLWGGWVLMVLL